MNNNYKYLVWMGTAVLGALFIFLIAVTNQTLNTAATTNTISFTGEGKVSAKPDIALIDFSIVTEATTSKAAQDDNSKKSQKIVDYIKKQGIADKDIKTSGYNVYPQYNNIRPCPIPVDVYGTVAPSYPCDNTQKITGYQATQSFQLKVRNLDNAGTLLDGLVAQGANQVNNLGFQIENPDKLKEQARQMAIEDAKTKARGLQNQLSIRLGRIVNYYEGGNYPIYMMDAKGGMGMGGGGSAPAPAIPSGENDIVIDVTITYQIR